MAYEIRTLSLPDYFANDLYKRRCTGKKRARKVQTEVSLTASWNKPLFVPHMLVKAAMDGRTFLLVEGDCTIAGYLWQFTEEPCWDLHVNEVIHAYHAQQFEIYF